MHLIIQASRRHKEQNLEYFYVNLSDFNQSSHVASQTCCDLRNHPLEK